MTKKVKTWIQLFLGIVAMCIIVYLGFVNDNNLMDSLQVEMEENSLEDVNADEDKVPVDGNIIIDFIDVGQGDSILIRQGEHSMLIDGGTTECEDDLLNYLNGQSIDYFDYIIGTHPHEDHIGSLDDVISAYNFDTILFPKVTTTTKTFENLVSSVKEKEKQFTTPEVGAIYEFGDATFEILAPNDDSYSSLNNYSIVIKLTYGDNSFLFTGDAEELSEKEILNNNSDLKADVIKLGHHGSSTSTSGDFLTAVSPSYAVISVGENNTYGHPTKLTMDKLKLLEIPVYRTDEQGTIECVSDGTNITFNVEPGTYEYLGY